MKQHTIEINGTRYFADRPSNCKDCFFWKNNKQRCVLKEYNCYFLAAPATETSKCDDCPYAQGRACVSLSCYKDLAKMVEGRR